MNIKYDPSVDAAYVYIVPCRGVASVASTYCCDPAQVDGQIHLDFDDEGRLLGIEVLDASRKLPLEAIPAGEGTISET